MRAVGLVGQRSILCEPRTRMRLYIDAPGTARHVKVVAPTLALLVPRVRGTRGRDGSSSTMLGAFRGGKKASRGVARPSARTTSEPGTTALIGRNARSRRAFVVCRVGVAAIASDSRAARCTRVRVARQSAGSDSNARPIAANSESISASSGLIRSVTFALRSTGFEEARRPLLRWRFQHPCAGIPS